MSPPPRLVPTLRSARSPWLEARVGYCRLRPTAASHAADTHAPARACTRRTPGLTVIANDQSLRFLSFMQSAPCRYHYPRISRHAQRLSFLLRGSHPFLGRPLFLCFCFALRRPLFLSACFALRCAPRPPARKNDLPSARTDERSSTANAAGYLVRGPSYPRHRFSSGFYPFFALSVFAFTCAFWLRASVRAWAGQGRDRATGFFESATSLTSFSQIFVADPKKSFSWPSKRLLHAFTF